MANRCFPGTIAPITESPARQTAAIHLRRIPGRWKVVVRPYPWVAGDVDQVLDTLKDARAYAAALERRFGWPRAAPPERTA